MTIFGYRITGAVASMVVDMLDAVLVDALQAALGEPQVRILEALSTTRQMAEHILIDP